MPAADAAIYYEPDGYQVAGRNVMGRHAAGHAYLRAAASAHAGRDLWAYTGNQGSFDAFAADVGAIDPSVKPRWCPRHRLDLLGQVGTLYYPGPDLENSAKLRLRRGVDAYSLCGVTHTTASHRALDALAAGRGAPLMPWDAVICTSRAVLATAELQREAEADYLRWRFGPGIVLPQGPRLPVIPLGIHAADFTADEGERARARAELGVAEDETVALFVGRLSYHAKAHPDAMYHALEAASDGGRRRFALVQCGWWGNDAVERAYRTGASRAAPNVRALWTDGRVPEERRRSWAAADVFISLSDNIQETFGLTPLEAMAAGLPVIVTDWDGYKDTVRDGVDGYRIRTTMPPPGTGNMLAERYEAGTLNYDYYCGYACALTAVDLGQLARRLAELADDPELRRTLGRNARTRARETYDWSVIYAAYRALWEELASVRRAAASFDDWRGVIERAPRVAPARGDPMKNFGGYPTAPIGPDTAVARAERPDGQTYAELRDHALFSFAKAVLVEPAVAEAARAAAATPTTVASIARRIGKGVNDTTWIVGALAKMGLVTLGWPD